QRARGLPKTRALRPCTPRPHGAERRRACGSRRGGWAPPGPLTSAALLPSLPTPSAPAGPSSSHHVSSRASRGAARTAAGRRAGWRRDSRAGALGVCRRPGPRPGPQPGKMESTAYPLNLTLKEEEEEEEIQSRELEDGPTDMQKVRICSEGGWVSKQVWGPHSCKEQAWGPGSVKSPQADIGSKNRPDQPENEDLDVKSPDWAGPPNATSRLPQPRSLDGLGLRLPQDIAELPEWGEGYPFYMAMGFPGYDLSADDLAGKFQFSRGMRRSYDAGFKLMVVEFAESTNNCQAAKQFGVLEKNVRDWRKVKPQLQNAHAMRRAFRGPKNGRFALVDQRVAEYVRSMQAKGDPITREAMQLKALEIAQEMNIPEKGFKASLGWCRRMMRRYDLSLRHKVPVPQQLPEDLTEKLVTYQRSVLALRRAHDYQVAQMGNADETPICLEVPSRVTVDNQGEKPVLVKTPGREKLKITAMLGVLADGRKLPPYIILRGTYIPPGKFPSGMEIRCHRYGWMTEDLMQDWLEVVWRRRTGAAPKQRGMLILNGFRGHATDSVKSSMESMNTDMVIIPGGLTSQLQVLDVVVYKPLNDSQMELCLKQLGRNILKKIPQRVDAQGTAGKGPGAPDSWVQTAACASCPGPQPPRPTPRSGVTVQKINVQGSLLTAGSGAPRGAVRCAVAPSTGAQRKNSFFPPSVTPINSLTE
ncbi:hypothetical protein MC885_012543, partial [Smutsia gigantea]